MASLESDGTALGGCRLLLAEDNMTIALSLALLLENKGCCVFKAARCDQALELSQTHAFDIALLDVTLADGPVYPAAEALASQGVPVLFLTGHNAQRLPRAWRRWPVLEKSIDPDAIVQRVIASYRVAR